jgi:hypothetical protein
MKWLDLKWWVALTFAGFFVQKLVVDGVRHPIHSLLLSFQALANHTKLDM